MKPKLVYKYRPDFKRDLKSIEENYFYAPSIDGLNDPCETLVYIDKKFNIQTGLLDNVKKYLDILIGVDRRKKLGIYSLSKTYKDELLWAHYADSHKGFCIEYDFSVLLDSCRHEEKSPFPFAFPVIYSDKPPQIDQVDVLNLTQDKFSIIEKIAGQKSKRWEYEKEYRILTDGTGENTHSHKAVKAIYFGLRMEEDHKKAMMDRLKGRGIKYFQMVLVDKSYNFEAKPVNDPNDNKLTYLTEIPSSVTRSFPVKYKITKKHYNWVLKKGDIDITLESKIKVESIIWLTQLIDKDIFKNVERIYLSYRIKGDSQEEMPWAASETLNGKVEVTVYDFKIIHM